MQLPPFLDEVDKQALFLEARSRCRGYFRGVSGWQPRDCDPRHLPSDSLGTICFAAYGDRTLRKAEVFEFMHELWRYHEQ